MSRAAKQKVKLAAELVSKGATILGEACPQCGGVQVRYRGKVYCTSHEDLSSVASEEAVSYDTVVAGMREALLSKLNEAANMLAAENEMAKQDEMVSLMTKYFDLLQKLPRKGASP